MNTIEINHDWTICDFDCVSLISDVIFFFFGSFSSNCFYLFHLQRPLNLANHTICIVDFAHFRNAHCVMVAVVVVVVVVMVIPAGKRSAFFQNDFFFLISNLRTLFVHVSFIALINLLLLLPSSWSLVVLFCVFSFVCVHIKIF